MSSTVVLYSAVVIPSELAHRAHLVGFVRSDYENKNTFCRVGHKANTSSLSFAHIGGTSPDGDNYIYSNKCHENRINSRNMENRHDDYIGICAIV